MRTILELAWIWSHFYTSRHFKQAVTFARVKQTFLKTYNLFSRLFIPYVQIFRRKCI